MQPRDKNVSFDGEPDVEGAGGGTADAGGAQETDPADPAGQDPIRERQRRRRNAGRVRADMTAILSRPDEADEEDEDETEEEAPPGPPPARVFVVFRGASWEDPQGGLRESDSIQGVFASEEAARRAVATLEREGGAGAESWYQPYPVQD
jgi:hypothetical protein